jgi:hypothetical protein
MKFKKKVHIFSLRGSIWSLIILYDKMTLMMKVQKCDDGKYKPEISKSKYIQFMKIHGTL